MMKVPSACLSTFLSEKFILWNKYAVPAQVLAFLSSLQASREASREARVSEEQKERKMEDVLLWED